MSDPRKIGFVYVMHLASETVEQNTSRIDNMFRHIKENIGPDEQQRLSREINDAFPGIGFESFNDAITTVPTEWKNQDARDSQIAAASS